MSVIIIPDDSTLAIIGFDVTFSETSDFVVTPTTNPVEAGSVINDHIVQDPASFVCEVGETNQPIEQTFELEGQRLPTDLQYLQAPPSLTLFKGTEKPNPPTVETFQLPNPSDRIRRIIDQLIKLQKSDSLVTIETLRHEYTSMKLIRIGEPGQLWHLGRITLEFKEIRIVSNQTVSAPQPKEPRPTPPADTGSQPPDPFDAFVPSWLKGSGKSIGAKLVDHYS